MDESEVDLKTLPSQLLTVFCLSQLATANCIKIQADAKGVLKPTSVGPETHQLSELLELADESKKRGK